MDIIPENTIFIVLSFEGLDVYSMAGGLGTRVTYLTNTLTQMGFQVHHIFLGDPNMAGMEVCNKGKPILHRWCQWISKYHPGGVYDGEEGKLHDFTQSAPPFVIRELLMPAIYEGKVVVVLGEEWHTAEAMCRINEMLRCHVGLRDMTVMFWNANNTYGFERIDWGRLSNAATITTVSKYMKQIMQSMGINPLVIPNGIPKALLNEVRERDVSALREMLQAGLTLSKVARWHPDKGWKTAIGVMDGLKRSGRRPVLLARGSAEPYGKKITREASLLGLVVQDIVLERDTKQAYHHAVSEDNFTPYFQAISRGSSGDIINLLFPVPHSFLRVIYRASDVVLANSTREPFGLVALEAMATGSVVFTGHTGEDYATHMYNSIVLDTFNADEIQFYIDYLNSHPESKEKITTAAKRTAQRWTWEEVVKTLICKLEYQASIQGIDLT